ncbi:DNA-directed RNA polymerase subunit omega [Paenibacillus thalictri]|uniref:DNA-directed RNA polymerase subunit omega n=1 Tax=Paenibacillus thalictri TaxID=2527873 RepID=A0A4Q9DRQ6_9BACL|nr:DNA-directed RNA polymerase subunit omega [Paenibacillus thalictri]TBL78331.1 DNA-directed RNA polymerase subunit omega [Paenibacillus thalictri]
MLYPSIDKLLDKVDSKYSLVVAAARRARLLRDGAKSEVRDRRSSKYVGLALEEIYEDHIRYEKLQNKENTK